MVKNGYPLDLAGADDSTGIPLTEEGRELLRRIAAMLTSLARAAADNT